MYLSDAVMEDTICPISLFKLVYVGLSTSKDLWEKSI